MVGCRPYHSVAGEIQNEKDLLTSKSNKIQNLTLQICAYLCKSAPLEFEVSLQFSITSQTTMAARDLCYLPDECWECIFMFLNDDTDRRYLKYLSLVSKRFLLITNRVRFSHSSSGIQQLVSSLATSEGSLTSPPSTYHHRASNLIPFTIFFAIFLLSH
jgi:hypothetical protein